MMIIGFFGMSIFLIIGIMILSIIVNKHESNHRRETFYLLIAAEITIISYTSCFLINNKNILMWLFAFYLLSTDILVFHLIRFFLSYSGTNSMYERHSFIFKLLLVGDFILLFLNYFFRHIFYLEKIEFEKYSFYKLLHADYYFLHFLIVYFFVVFAFYIIFSQLIKSKKFYKRKYFVFCISYLVIIIVNLVSRFFNNFIDYSVIFYGLLAVAIVYFSYQYVPNIIKKKLEGKIFHNFPDIILGYDNEGICQFEINKSNVSDKFIKEIEKEANFRLKNINNVSWNKKIKYKSGIKFYNIFVSNMIERETIIGKYIIIYDKTLEFLSVQNEQRLLTYDNLTGIYNSEMFCIKAKQLLDQNPDEKFYMLYSDIRNFKMINDLYGDIKGDQILKSFAKNLERDFSIIEKCIYGRMQKDNFVLLIPKKMFNVNVFKKYNNELNALIDKNFQIFIHLGIYEIEDTNAQIRNIIDKAKVAISVNKNNYKKFVWYYDKTIREKEIKEQKIVNSFYNSLNNNEFKMFLQPQVDKNGKVIGAEALVRKVSEEGQIVNPGEFIPTLEKTGLIESLDKFIWEEACKKISDWKNNDMYISINISPIDFYYNNILNVLNKMVNKYNIKKDRLRLEITEAAFMDEKDNRLNLINELKKNGYIIEMDDFGSGYSSLNYLKNMNFDIVKLDMGFLGDEIDDKSSCILKSMIDLCKKLDMKVVIEGVETQKQISELDKLDFDILQGYYYSKPISIYDFEKKYINKRDDQDE